MSLDYIVELRNVVKIYEMGKIQVHALQGINLSVQRGEFVVILGPLILGVKIRTIIKLITMESLILAFFGLLIGTGLGYLVAYLLIQFFIQAAAEEIVMLTLTIQPLSYFYVVSTLLITVFASQIPAMRYISKLNLASTVKEAVL